MKYETPAALEMAVKAAAKASPVDTGQAVSGFYFHRFLCRVFSIPGQRFVLKGGQSMLARTIDARATRDIDLLSHEHSLDEALEALRRAADIDLGDHIRFVFERAVEIKTDDEYRSGLNVVFMPWLGPRQMQPISIDLVVDEFPLDDIEFITPADRIEIEGLSTCDYPIFPAEYALADKLCAISERHGERPSSRIKDLIDILVYATTCPIDGSKLSSRIKREAGARRIDIGPKFHLPDEWSAYDRQFSKLRSQTGLPDSYASISAAAELASKLFDPVLSSAALGLSWDPSNIEWK